MKIDSVESVPFTRPMAAAVNPLGTEPSGLSFGETIREVFESTNRLQKQADKEIQAFAVGRSGDLHKTMIAMEEADVSFQLLMQIRNKIVAAYQEIMRMQI